MATKFKGYRRSRLKTGKKGVTPYKWYNPGKSHRCKLIEQELLNEDRGPPVSSPNIPTFLDIINQDLKLRTIESNFNWLAQKIDERDPKINNIFLNIHLSYYKSSEFSF